MAFEELKQKQSVMWGAGPYEPITELTQGVHAALIEALVPGAGERWLDVATGTGAVALRAARAGARVTGIDLSPALIETARGKATREALDVRFEVGDAEALAVEDGAFDVVCSAIGTQFAPDHQAVARELARTCRVGGRLGLACWGPDMGRKDLTTTTIPTQVLNRGPAGVRGPADSLLAAPPGSTETEP